MNKRDHHQLETGYKYMRTMKKIFDYIGRTITLKAENTFSYPEDWSDMKKKRVQNKYAQLRKGIESNRFMLNENESVYNKSMMEDRNRLAVETSAKEERKKMHDEIYYNKRRQEELEQSRKYQEEQELEKRAQLDLRMASELKMNLNNAKLTAPNKKKKIKKHEIIEDDEGNMPLQNFAGGANDEEENSFKVNFQNDLEKIDTTRKPKKKEKKQSSLPGEKKRLKKKMVINNKDSDGDEDLSLEPVLEETQLDYSRQKLAPKKTNRLDVEESDGDDSDLADRINDVNDDEEETANQTQNVNFGDKNDDHENVF